MGDTGPCGPCSEIHVDIRNEEDRKAIDGKTLVNESHPLVIEIWNLVFMQYNRMANGSLQSLPAKHVDTGMGFERLCMVLQGKQSNYDTDVFQPVIQKISALCGIKYGESAKADVAMRVIADHVRAIAFAIADGQLPSNNKAGYVIRRILRRAVRYGYTFLNLNEPFIYKLIPVLKDQLGSYFTELGAQQSLIDKVIAEEEGSFLRTLSHGINKFNQYVAANEGEKVIKGDFAFELYDTYGFPIDLTSLMAREAGLDVDMEGFSKGLELQKERSRKDASQETGDWVILIDAAEEKFVGYDTLETKTRITRYRKVTAKGKEIWQIALETTPFYAESGGQIGDCGFIEVEGEKINVTDTRKENNLIIHLADKLPAHPQAEVKAVVSAEARLNTANNHSATHLMHYALRNVLGTHVEQKGSYVGPDYLRFDFSHFQKLSNEEIKEIEKQVNEMIRQNSQLDEHRSVPVEEARNSGALALFGEKYGDKVRTIRFGNSIELCGGTHASFTGQIGMFKITSESAIAAGVRRIEAITAAKAEEFFNKQNLLLQEIKELVKNPVDPVRGIKNLLDENNKLKHQIEQMKAEKARELFSELLAGADNINSIKFIAHNLEIDPAVAKDLAFKLIAAENNLVVVLGTDYEKKPGLTVAVSEQLSADGKYNAVAIIKELAKEIKGGGGGQPHIATAGGKDLNGLTNIPEKAKALILAI
jgi:alanyl-tRNA synthetase